MHDLCTFESGLQLVDKDLFVGQNVPIMVWGSLSDSPEQWKQHY
jgi:hypothetical protein